MNTTLETTKQPWEMTNDEYMTWAWNEAHPSEIYEYTDAGYRIKKSSLVPGFSFEYQPNAGDGFRVVVTEGPHEIPMLYGEYVTLKALDDSNMIGVKTGREYQASLLQTWQYSSWMPELHPGHNEHRISVARAIADGKHVPDLVITEVFPNGVPDDLPYRLQEHDSVTHCDGTHGFTKCAQRLYAYSAGVENEEGTIQCRVTVAIDPHANIICYARNTGSVPDGLLTITGEIHGNQILIRKGTDSARVLDTITGGLS